MTTFQKLTVDSLAKTYLAIHPEEDIFQVRSVIALVVIAQDAPEVLKNRTEHGGLEVRMAPGAVTVKV